MIASRCFLQARSKLARALAAKESSSIAHAHDRIPTISIAPLIDPDSSLAARQAVADEIGHAASTVGFMTIVDYGIPQQVIDDMWKASTEFFDLDESEKLKLVTEDEKTYPFGYSPLGGEVLAAGAAIEAAADGAEASTGMEPDRKEMFSIGPADPKSGMPPRRYPPKPDTFADAAATYYSALEGVAGAMLRGFALALDRPEPFFEPHCVGHRSAVRLLNYPGGAAPGSIRASEHTDYGTMTLLCADAPGLQAKTTAGEWVDVPVIKDGLIVNFGDLMARWTNGKWLSTPHRVTALEYEGRRRSIAFFHNVNADTVIDSADFVRPDEEPAYPRINASDFLMQKHLASIGAAGARSAEQDA